MNAEQEYKFICEKCYYKTNLLSSLKKHNNSELHITGKRKIRKDKAPEPIVYKCSTCNYITDNEHNLKTHNLNNHQSKEDRKTQFKYYCEKCDFGTFIELTFTKHTNTNKHKIKTN